MKILKLMSLTLILCLLSISGFTATNNFDKLSAEILESLQSFYPVHATEMGVHAYDHRFTDYSSSSVKAMIKKLTNFEKKLYPFKSAPQSEHNKINYKLIKANTDIALMELKKLKWHTRTPQLYVDEAVNGLYYLLLSNHAPLNERVVTIIERMKAVPALFNTARKNIKKPPVIYIEAASESLESGIKFYREVAGELMNQFPERADKILRVSTLAREAMNDYLIYLSELTPGDDKAFAIGKSNYDYKLTNEYLLPYDSDSLLKIGLALYDEANVAYRDYEKYIEDNHQNGSDSIFVPANFSRQDILDYYHWETEQVKLFLSEHNIVSVPENIAPLVVIETPAFLRSMVGGIAYQPAGPFDANQTGYFYVRPIADDLDRKQLEGRFRYTQRRGFKGSVVHEAFPGHHLQMQIAGQNADPVRKWQSNNMMIEGWALYSEQMMYENGLYGEEDHNQWLGVLGGIRFRAARIVADVKLHTGQFTYDECVDWMNEALDISSESGRAYIKKEVRKICHYPTNRISYMMGKREILSLLNAYKAQKGDSFKLIDFHDALLAEGSIPPVLMWDIMKLK